MWWLWFFFFAVTGAERKRWVWLKWVMVGSGGWVVVGLLVMVGSGVWVVAEVGCWSSEIASVWVR